MLTKNVSVSFDIRSDQIISTSAKVVRRYNSVNPCYVQFANRTAAVQQAADKYYLSGYDFLNWKQLTYV